VVRLFTYIFILGLLTADVHFSGFAQTTPTTDKMFEVQHNPGSDFLTIKIFGNQPNLDKFVMMNLIGRSVADKKYNLGDELIRVTELSNLPNGLYVVTARDKNGKLLSSVKFYL
jgi:hypothetical protein